MTWIPTVHQVLAVHNELVSLFEAEEDPISPPGVKSQDMLESACSRPHVGIGNHDKYKTTCDKAAALFFSLIKNHPFHNGNKRTALVTLLTMLHRNDFRLTPEVTDDDVYDLTVSIAGNRFPDEVPDAPPDIVTDALSGWIRNRTERANHETADMLVEDFAERCQQAGARVKDAGQGRAISITYNNRSIRINKNVRTIAGGVVRKYLRNLRLSESGAGLDDIEFRGGASGERQEIYRYIAALRRLAKT